MVSLWVKNVVYSLKYTGQPIPKALIFKSVTLFHSWTQNFWTRKFHLFCGTFPGTWWPDLQGERIPAPRSLQQPTSQLAFGKVVLRALGEFGAFVGAWSLHSSYRAQQQTFLCSKLRCFHLFGLTVHWTHKLAFTNNTGQLIQALRNPRMCLKPHS